MKLSFLLLLTMMSSGLFGQTLTGNCINSTGAPAEYVNIGLYGHNIGTVSDADGRFSITIPDSLRNRSLVFSHVSYEPFTADITELKDLSPLTITLQEKAFDIQSVVVRPTGRTINLNSRGIRMPGMNVTYTFNLYAILDNIGQMFDLRQKSRINEMHLDITQNTFDELILRLVLYQVENPTTDSMTFRPLTPVPLYVYPDKSDNKQHILWDISEYCIETDGTVYTSIELVKRSPEGQIRFPAYSKSSKWFVNFEKGIFKEYPIGIGIVLKGTELD